MALRFPFSSHQPPNQPNKPSGHRHFPLVAAAASIGLGVGLSLYLQSSNQPGPVRQNPWAFASLSFADGASATSVEPKTGVSFPSVLDGTRRLLAAGVRKKSVFGLKNIDVYAFGVYADDNDVKELSKKYSERKENKEVISDVLDQDVRMTVRLQIVYGRLSIRSVRSAFEESVGSRLLKFGGPDNKELLQRFTSYFKDEYPLPRGSIIDLAKEKDFILQVKIDGKEVGSIQSKLLCKSVLDLYVGDDPFDKRAKEDFELGLESLLKT
ncbi:uncharacterized protein A4U43_C10F2170 [Asparagus officinalis]|uniref:Chalcone--flavanone isomerase n=1 Tax=Asparagus officinalis TaxID=4686 RepID=A0A5P1E4E6_ASPOF|nr:fatty-acid-binding protein 1 [Asparagus officinalis]ONK55906.1 uncharacterized protein A4U43_C10F2170 [Asparagus officinalis]